MSTFWVLRQETSGLDQRPADVGEAILEYFVSLTNLSKRRGEGVDAGVLSFNVWSHRDQRACSLMNGQFSALLFGRASIF